MRELHHSISQDFETGLGLVPCGGIACVGQHPAMDAQTVTKLRETYIHITVNSLPGVETDGLLVTGSLVICSLVYWFSGLLIYWFSGLLVLLVLWLTCFT